jgi:hypothetical protein
MRQALMKEENPGLRVIAVQALRYTLPEDSEAFDDILKGSLVDMLKTTLEDPDLEIRRHALSTFNSASHNKPELILGHCNQLIPYVMKETKIRPELVREVQMGPFKHIIDDGLEVRKVCCSAMCDWFVWLTRFVRRHTRHSTRSCRRPFLASASLICMIELWLV